MYLIIKNTKIIVRIPIHDVSAAHNSHLLPHSIALRKSKNFGNASSFCWRVALTCAAVAQRAAGQLRGASRQGPHTRGHACCSADMPCPWPYRTSCGASCSRSPWCCAVAAERRKERNLFAEGLFEVQDDPQPPFADKKVSIFS